MRKSLPVMLLTALVLLAPPARAQTFTTIYQFPNNMGPQTALLVGSKGQILGTTLEGGLANAGTIFALSPPAQLGGAWTETTLYNYPSEPNCSATCDPSGLTAGKGGVYYGTTAFGGTYGFGTVYQLSPPAAPGDQWTVDVLYSFTGSSGATPLGGVTAGRDGKLYGAAYNGGAFGFGAIFELTPPVAGGTWTEATIYAFQGGMMDGALPYSSPVFGLDGRLYGGAIVGGTTNSGNIYQLTRPANGQGPWTERILYAFNGLDGGGAIGRLIFGKNGTLYGTTVKGGVSVGTVFALYPPAVQGGAWTLQNLHEFGAAHDGLYPFAGVTFGPDGALYGTTEQTQGPGGGGSSFGVLYKIVLPAKPGEPATESVVYNFAQSPGQYPTAPLTLGPDGDLYGDTSEDSIIFQFQP